MLKDLNWRPNSPIISEVPSCEVEMKNFSQPQLTENSQDDETQKIEKYKGKIAYEISFEGEDQLATATEKKIEKDCPRTVVYTDLRDQLPSPNQFRDYIQVKIINETFVDEQNKLPDNRQIKFDNFTSKNELKKEKSNTSIQNQKIRIYEYCECKEHCQNRKCGCRSANRKCKNGCKCIPKSNTCNNPKNLPETYQNQSNNGECPTKQKKLN